MSKLTKNPEKRSTGMAVTGPTKVATWEGTQRDLTPIRLLFLRGPGAHSPRFQERAGDVRTDHPGHPWPGWHRSTPLGRNKLASCTRRGQVGAQRPSWTQQRGQKLKKHGGLKSRDRGTLVWP